MGMRQWVFRFEETSKPLVQNAILSAINMESDEPIETVSLTPGHLSLSCEELAAFCFLYST
jgi:hypothetical protein